MRKSPTSQTEKAFTAYVQGNSLDTVLQPVSVYAGGLVDVPAALTPPYLIFSASAPAQLNNECGIYELTLTACLATQVDDEMDVTGQDIHRERLEALRDLLENVSAIQAYVNAPTMGTDSRSVQNFFLSAIVYDSEETKAEDRRLMTELSYYVVACPSD